MIKSYLAYGSNLNIRQMKRRCPGAMIFGTALLKNWRLAFKGSKSGSYLTIEPCQGACVPAAVWVVTENNIAALDRYEGFPDFYYKKEMTVNIKRSDSFFKNVDAFVYIMREDRPYGQPNPYYVEICRKGYRSFGFDENVLDEAVERNRCKL